MGQPKNQRQGKRRQGPGGVAGEARTDGPGRVRIIGGQLRGRTLTYSGELRLRPMKDRTREAVFNLVGPIVREAFAWDLFAGTGALGVEAVSRGARGAILIEQHIPSFKLIRDNLRSLGIQDQVSPVQADVFRWVAMQNDLVAAAKIDENTPWVVFCCPPYAFFRDRFQAMHELLETLQRKAPEGSVFVVEAESPFDFETFWQGDWDVRSYAPAIVGIWRKAA